MDTELIDSILDKISKINKEEEEQYNMKYLSSEESAKILNNGGNEIFEQEIFDPEIDSFKKPWGKLNKQNKLNRTMKYIKEIEKRDNLNPDQTKKLRILLINAIENRLITRKSDVEYCEEKGEILRIDTLKRDRRTGEFQIGSTPRLSKVTTATFVLPGSLFTNKPHIKQQNDSTVNSKPIVKTTPKPVVKTTPKPVVKTSTDSIMVKPKIKAVVKLKKKIAIKKKLTVV